MLTFREARQRLTLAEMRISRVGGTPELRVFFPEDDYRKQEKNAYYTDCIEDAMLTGLKMRRNRGNVQ